MTRHYRKYINRRLYGILEGEYVTLAAVEQVIRDGHEISVLRYRDKIDITAEVLLHILQARERKARTLDEATLTAMIRR